MSRRLPAIACVAIALSCSAEVSAQTATRCFILYDLTTDSVVRAPRDSCATRVSPASTFKIPHALAALDSGVIPDARFAMEYDGKPVRFRVWRRTHTLASAMRHSVLWYFQRIARRLGPGRERAYARKFRYGNADTSSGLTTFWIAGSLAISPDEEIAFLVRLYRDQLPVSRASMRAVRAMLVQPAGVVTNAMGAHDFAAPWPSGTVVSAKTGSIENESGHAIRWIVGHVQRGSHAWIFAANVVGPARAAPPLAAIQLAAARLRDQGVL